MTSVPEPRIKGRVLPDAPVADDPRASGESDLARSCGARGFASCGT